MRLFVRNLLHALARDYDAIRPVPDEAGVPDEPAEATPVVDPRDAHLHEVREQLADAQTQVAELTDQVVKLTAAANQHAVERAALILDRDRLAEELDKTRTRLAATHHAHHAKTTSATWTYADPPPTSDRTLYLREKERADGLATRLAAAEAALHDRIYPRVRQATNV